MNEAIITRGLVKKYGRHAALNGFTLAVPSGSITGLVGRNGAGKTTWMMTVAGFVIPDAGEVSILLGVTAGGSRYCRRTPISRTRGASGRSSSAMRGFRG